MSWILDLSNSYLLFSDLETVTLQHRSPTGSETVVGAKRLCSNVGEADNSYGAYQRQVLDFRLPSVNVVTEPQPGDTILDGSSLLFIILGVDAPANNDSWRCNTNRLRIEDLGHTVQYVRMTDLGSSATTARTIIPTDVGNPLACAIQPQERVVSDRFGAKTDPQRYKIWLYDGVGVPILAGDCFRDELGTVYEILVVENRKSLTSLSTFTCVKKL